MQYDITQLVFVGEWVKPQQTLVFPILTLLLNK